MIRYTFFQKKLIYARCNFEILYQQKKHLLQEGNVNSCKNHINNAYAILSPKKIKKHMLNWAKSLVQGTLITISQKFVYTTTH